MKQTGIRSTLRCTRSLHMQFGIAVLVQLGITATTCSQENNWPQFLGIHRNGISAETGLIDKWPDKGPKVIWRSKGGVGMSGLAIDRGSLITMVQIGDEQQVLALNAKTGEELWRTAVAPAYENPQGDGPRATPNIDGEAVYVYTGEGVLASLNFNTGKLAWSHDVVKEHDGKPSDYGMSCSPLVVGDQVIVCAGAPDATVVAYHKKSGEVAWKTGDGPAGYASPTLLKIGERQQIVAFVGAEVLGLEPGSGQVLWSYPYETDFACNTASPISVDGNVFISAGENHGSTMLAIEEAAGELSAKEVWASLGPRSAMRNEWQTSILLDGFLYGLDNVGGAGPITNLVCLNSKTGEQVWIERRFGKGNLIAAEGKLFISTLNGELVVVRATPDGYQEIGRKNVVGKTRQAPALANGLLYLRDEKEIICLDVRKQ